MKQFVLAALLFLSLSASSVAQSIVFHQSDLPYTREEESCDVIIKYTNTNRYTKLKAANLYAHGKHMGERCFRPDYIRAFELFVEAGFPNAIKPHLRRLQSKASSGNPLAKTWIKKLKKAGYIK